MKKKLSSRLPDFHEENSQQQLEVLVEELMKNSPNKVKVKKLMTACGLPYSADPLRQISTVLNSMSTPIKNQSPDRDFEI